VPHAQALDRSELPQDQNRQGQSNQQPDPSLLEQPSPDPSILGASVQKTLTQSMIVQNLSAVTLQGDNQKQSPAGVILAGAASIKDGPRAKHKTETKADERSHPGDSPLPVASPVILQQINVVISVPTLQADGPRSVPVKPSSKAVREGIPDQAVTSRGPFPAVVSSHGASRGTSFTTPKSLTMAQPPGVIASKEGTPPESVSSETNSVSHTNMLLAPPLTGKANAGLQVLPNQDPHPQIAHATNGLGTNGVLDDPRVLKEAEKGIGAELKPEVKGSVSVSPIPIPPALQHPQLPTASPAVTHDAEKTMATHRPETSAAQVLQKMDFAGPSGAVQLRADARRLDVGVSSGALGWVEVRATTQAGRVDATLHVQNDASAQILTSQSREISDYAREHSVQLGQVSVGVGTGDSAQGQSHSTHTRDGNAIRARGTTAQSLVDTEQMHPAADAMSLISVRA
jgi:hypothetical protein